MTKKIETLEYIKLPLTLYAKMLPYIQEYKESGNINAKLRLLKVLRHSEENQIENSNLPRYLMIDCKRIIEFILECPEKLFINSENVLIHLSVIR